MCVHPPNPRPSSPPATFSPSTACACSSLQQKGTSVSILNEVLSANEQYAATFGEKSQLALPPARGFAILTCMDARLDPAKYAGGFKVRVA